MIFHLGEVPCTVPDSSDFITFDKSCGNSIHLQEYDHVKVPSCKMHQHFLEKKNSLQVMHLLKEVLLSIFITCVLTSKIFLLNGLFKVTESLEEYHGLYRRYFSWMVYSKLLKARKNIILLYNQFFYSFMLWFKMFQTGFVIHECFIILVSFSICIYTHQNGFYSW